MQTRTLRTDPIDDVGQRLCVSLAADEKSVATEVIDDELLATQLAVLAFAFQLSITMGIPNRYGSDWQ